ncbi:MAG: PAS domain-containing protein [Acidobacteriaceae bacterium]|nr:PAS domain-containing protein [Acidobacteriaceae bacterium]
MPLLAGRYDPWLVALSVIIAVCASYTALGLASRTTAAQGRKRLAWLTGGACAMGFGIWSMHYVGMLAFSLPVPVRYDFPTVIASLLAAIFASAVALFVVSRPQVPPMQAAIGSVFMGTGIVGMHYIGMNAMRLPAMCEYDDRLVALSCVIAVTGSLAALWFTFHLRNPRRNRAALKVLSAMAMGAAIAAMHYTGMSAASFRASRGAVDYSHAVSVSDLGITGIVVVTFLVLGFAFFTSLLDQQLTAQQALGEELYRSKQMLQSILDNIPQRVFWKDLDGRYVGCNQAFANDMDLKGPDDVRGKTDEELAGFESLIKHLTDLGNPLKTGRPMSDCQYEIPSGGDSARWLRASATALRDLNGRICGLLGTYEDVTTQKRAEEAIRRSNAALSEFAHVVSHDLQSPLRVATNYIQLLERMHGKQLNEEAHSFLRFVENSLRNMTELIQSLLKYATATEPEPEGQGTVSLAKVLERALVDLQLLVAETGAQITTDRLPEITAYPVQITQVVENLLSNAIKYRKPDVPPRIHFGATERSDSWVISVRDNGIGIPPEFQGRIFTPLKRLHGAEIPGFGIGLATCRRVIEHHGGRIWLESEPDVGSTFYFSVRKPRAGGNQNVYDAGVSVTA